MVPESEPPAAAPRRIPTPFLQFSVEHTLPPIPDGLKSCFRTMFHLLRGVRLIRDAAVKGWHRCEPGTGPCSIIIFVGDYYALADWYKIRFAEGLPALLKTRTSPINVPHSNPPRFICAASAVWDICSGVAHTLADTPQGRVATSLVGELPDDGRFDRTAFIPSVYRLQLKTSVNQCGLGSPEFRREVVDLLQSDEAKSVERTVREWLRLLPIEFLWTELEWEFGQASAADPVGRAETEPPGADSKQKNSGKMPDSVDVRDLCHLLGKNMAKIELGEISEIGVARNFIKEKTGNDRKAHNLLRQARRFRHLWKRDDK